LQPNAIITNNYAAARNFQRKYPVAGQDRDCRFPANCLQRKICSRPAVIARTEGSAVKFVPEKWHSVDFGNILVLAPIFRQGCEIDFRFDTLLAD